MKKNYLLILLLLSSYVGAEEVYFIPRLEVGFTNYSLSFNGTFPLPTGISNQSNKFTGTSFFSRIGFSISYNNLFIDISKSDFESLSDVQLIPELNLVEKWTGERQESNIALGYRFFETGSFFVGYRSSEISASGAINSSLKYVSNGPFVGMNYGIPIEDTGLLAFNAAYAFLDTDFDESIFGFTIPTATGDGEGIKYGISYQGFLTEDMGYSLAVDRYRYKNRVRNNVGVDSKMIEKESILKVGLTYIF